MSEARRKGSAFESAVVRYLAEHGFPDCERRVMGGSRDRGDIAGVSGWVLEAKATRTLDLAGAMTEAKREAVNAGTARYAAVLKRRSHPVSDAYVVLPLHLFADLLRERQP
jgi:hypothetical protein